MNLRQLTAVITLFSIVLIYGRYFLWWWAEPRGLAETTVALITAVVAQAVLEAVLAIVVAVLHGRSERADERDRIVADRSLRWPYNLLIAGLVVSLALVWRGEPTETLITALAFSVVLAETVRYATQLINYRIVSNV